MWEYCGNKQRLILAPDTGSLLLFLVKFALSQRHQNEIKIAVIILDASLHPTLFHLGNLKKEVIEKLKFEETPPNRMSFIYTLPPK